MTPPQTTKTNYDAVIVEDPYRLEAIGAFVEDLVRNKDDQPGLIFVRKKYHAALLARELTKRLGVEVPAVTSDTPKKERDRLIAEMAARRLPAAVCTDVWSTGIDIPRLAWVLLAGAGQAPAGLKQRCGRGTRLHDEKPGYVIYNWEDVGPDTEAYQEQSAQRLEHLEDGGFNVDGPAPAPQVQLEGTDPDVAALSELLTQRTAERPDDEAQAALEAWEERHSDDTWAPWRFLAFAVMFTMALIMITWDSCWGGG